MLKFNRTEFRAGSVYDFVPVILSEQDEEHAILDAVGSGAAVAVDNTPIPTNGANAAAIAIEVSGANYAGSHNLTVTFYRNGVILGTSSFTTSTINAGYGRVDAISDPNAYLARATHIAVSGNVTLDSDCACKISVILKTNASGLAVTENGYISLTNSWRTEPIVRKDTLATSLSGIASAATVTKNTEVYWPALGTTLNSCWDAFSINGGGGLGGYFAFTVGATTAAGSTPKIFVFATDDPNPTITSKRWGRAAFVRNGSPVTEIELAENITQVALLHVPIFHRYYAICMHEHDNVADVTGVYIDASVIPA